MGSLLKRIAGVAGIIASFAVCAAADIAGAPAGRFIINRSTWAGQQFSVNHSTATSLAVTGLTSGECVQAGTNGLLTTAGAACGTGGGGGSSTLAVFEDSVKVSSPTSIIKFDGTDFNTSLVGGSTAFIVLGDSITVTGVTLSSITVRRIYWPDGTVQVSSPAAGGGGSGDITGVAVSGEGLTGGGTSGDVTITIVSTTAYTTKAQTWTGPQHLSTNTILGNATFYHNASPSTQFTWDGRRLLLRRDGSYTGGLLAIRNGDVIGSPPRNACLDLIADTGTEGSPAQVCNVQGSVISLFSPAGSEVFRGSTGGVFLSTNTITNGTTIYHNGQIATGIDVTVGGQSVCLENGTNCPAGGSGDITGVAVSGEGITGGGTSGDVTIVLGSTVAYTTKNQTFTEPQTYTSSVSFRTAANESIMFEDLTTSSFMRVRPPAFLSPETHDIRWEDDSGILRATLGYRYGSSVGTGLLPGIEVAGPDGATKVIIRTGFFDDSGISLLSTSTLRFYQGAFLDPKYIDFVSSETITHTQKYVLPKSTGTIGAGSVLEIESINADGTVGLAWGEDASGSGGSGGGYAVEPATVTFQLSKGVTASTGTFTDLLLGTTIQVTSGTITTSLTVPQIIGGGAGTTVLSIPHMVHVGTELGVGEGQTGAHAFHVLGNSQLSNTGGTGASILPLTVTATASNSTGNTARGLDITASGANTTQGIRVSASGGVATNDAIAVTAGRVIFSSNTVLSNATFYYNAPAELSSATFRLLTTHQSSMTLSGGYLVQNIAPTSGQVLKFDGTNWKPDTDTGGGGGGTTIWVQQDDSNVDVAVSTIDVRSPLAVTSNPSGEVNLDVDKSSFTLRGPDPALGGALGGTVSNATVDDDGHNHTGATISGIDISGDTNLTVTYPVVLTGDTVSLNHTFTSSTTHKQGIFVSTITVSTVTVTGQVLVGGNTELKKIVGEDGLGIYTAGGGKINLRNSADNTSVNINAYGGSNEQYLMLFASSITFSGPLPAVVGFDDVEHDHYVTFKSSYSSRHTQNYVLPDSTGTVGTVLSIADIKSNGDVNLVWKTDATGGGGGGGSDALKSSFTYTFMASDSHLGASNSAVVERSTNALTPILLFDASTVEHSSFTTVLRHFVGGTIKVQVFYSMRSATSGTVEFDAAIACITPGDAQDTDTGSFAAYGTATETVPGTAGYLSTLTITPTNDSCAEGDVVMLSLFRDAGDGTNDTATGDAEVRFIRLYEE